MVKTALFAAYEAASDISDDGKHNDSEKYIKKEKKEMLQPVLEATSLSRLPSRDPVDYQAENRWISLSLRVNRL